MILDFEWKGLIRYATSGLWLAWHKRIHLLTARLVICSVALWALRALVGFLTEKRQAFLLLYRFMKKHWQFIGLWCRHGPLLKTESCHRFNHRIQSNMFQRVPAL